MESGTLQNFKSGICEIWTDFETRRKWNILKNKIMHQSKSL